MKYIDEKIIKVDLEASNKEEILRRICQYVEEAGFSSSGEELFKAVWSREEEMTTGLGRNTAFPHGKSGTVDSVKLFIGVVPQGVDYEAIDDEPVNLIFLSAVPIGADDEYRTLLGKVNSIVRQDDKRKRLISSKDKSEIIRIMREVIDE